MLLWVLIIVLLAATLALLLRPLYRGLDSLSTRAAYDASVYKDQLKAIDRELEDGLIDALEAESARLEISRKLLATSERAEKTPEFVAKNRELSRMAAMGLAGAIPVLALGIYVATGHPGLSDMPLEPRKIAQKKAMETARAKGGMGREKIADLIARAEQRLREKPDDGRGWAIMAPVYLRHRMYGKAAAAYENAIRLLGSNGERLAGLTDALVLGNNGVVGEAALPVIRRAIKADPNQPKPRFWLGLYHEQNGKPVEAEKQYAALLKVSPQDAPWRATVQGRHNDVRKTQGLPPQTIAGTAPAPKAPQIKLGDARRNDDGKLKGPSREDMEQVGEMSPEDRKTMINSMVENLAERLNEEGGDVNAWMRLVNAYAMLGKKDAAQKALGTAKTKLHANQQDVARLDALAKKLGLGS